MQPAQSIEQLRALSSEVRALRKGFLTNFYLDEAKHAIWISKGDCFIEHIGETLFIIKPSPTFWNVFYCSTTNEQLSSDIHQFQLAHAGQTMMFDVVGREAQCQPLVEMFRENGCIEATSLVRMIRLADPMDYTEDASIRLASESDIPIVSQLLHDYFDARTEQIPYDEELEDYACQGHVLICEEQGCVAGFLIYELNATTLYLRYWFTHPDFRDRKVGSRLLRRFLEEGKDTKRQIFWVIRTNENAIKRYKHYGFKEENMFDYVMQYDNNASKMNDTMREQIIKILTELRPEFDFTQEGVDFIEEGMLDSFDMVSLVDSIETEFGVAISGVDVLPENFCTVDAICKTIEKNRK